MCVYHSALKSDTMTGTLHGGVLSFLQSSDMKYDKHRSEKHFEQA